MECNLWSKTDEHNSDNHGANNLVLLLSTRIPSQMFPFAMKQCAKEKKKGNFALLAADQGLLLAII